MAQQPAKLAWKEKTPFGLSASQFGMALGFLGKVSDYVDYQRHIVGTEQEFKGNAATEHGINTEAKARALYEILTGIQVYDGGFFLSDERVLGCSPDGRSFYYPQSSAPFSNAVPQDGGRTGGDSRPHGQDGTDRTRRRDTTAKRCYSDADIEHGGSNVREPTLTSGLTLPNPEMPRASTSPPKVKTTFSVQIPFRPKKAACLDEPNRRSTSLPDLLGVEDPTSTVERASTCSAIEATMHCGKGQDTSPDHSNENGQLSVHSKGAASYRPCYPRRRMRLLEIKSPFCSLYDCKKELYRPFGIPQQYMCQMQGQMAIADADECDFFVYLDGPRCQVEAWRVYRSHAFWEWAHPKLLQVVQWVRDGLPPHITRSFSFEPFDFANLKVVPLVYPFCISSGSPLEDIYRFPYFHKFASPYYGNSTRPHVSNEVGEHHKPPGLMDGEAVKAVTSPFVKFLFDVNTVAEDEDSSTLPDTMGLRTFSTLALQGHGSGQVHGATDDPAVAGSEGPARPTCAQRVGHFRAAPFYGSSKDLDDLLYNVIYKGRWTQDLLVRTTNGAPTISNDNGYQRRITAETLRDADIYVTVPGDWEPGQVDVHIVLPSGHDTKEEHVSLRLPIRLFHREFFNLLETPTGTTAEPDDVCVVGVNATARASQGMSHEAGDPLIAAPRHRSRTPSSTSALVYIDVTPPTTRSRDTSRRPRLEKTAGASTVDMEDRNASMGVTNFVAGDGTTVITVLTPGRHDKSEPLSQQIRVSLTPQAKKDEPDHGDCVNLTMAREPSQTFVIGDDDAVEVLSDDGVVECNAHAVPADMRVPAPPEMSGATRAPPALVQRIDAEDLLQLVAESPECAKVLLIDALDSPVRTFWRDPLVLEKEGSAASRRSLHGTETTPDTHSTLASHRCIERNIEYELIVGPGDLLDSIARAADSQKVEQGVHTDARWHRSVTSLVARFAEYLAGRGGTSGSESDAPSLPMVLCFMEDASQILWEPSRPRRAVNTPCFVLPTNSYTTVIARLMETVKRWT